MSAPAAKDLSLPVMSIAPTASSRSNAASASPISRIISEDSAFSAFGRLRVIRPTRPRVSAMMCWWVIFYNPVGLRLS